MSTRRKIPKLISRLLRSFVALFNTLFTLMKQGGVWSLQLIQNSIRRPKHHRQRTSQNHPSFRQAGFVLPTTIMVLIVLGLVAGSLILRTGDRVEDVSRYRESQRIDSIATPAVDRAKAKLEHLFNRDPRFPAGVPSEGYLADMMRYVDNDLVDLITEGGVVQPDPYLLPDETRLDLNDDGVLDNAWTYQSDLDGDGSTEIVTYSVLMNTGLDNDCDGTVQRVDDNDDNDFPFNEDVNQNGSLDPGEDLNSNGELDVLYGRDEGRQACEDLGRDINEGDYGFWSDEDVKAEHLLTRSGPLSIQLAQGSAAECDIEGLENERGWFAANATSVRKNFQVNVFVESENDSNKSVTALEFQQDRQLDKGNKFGVWFRYDLLIHPGPAFRLNGAIHTDGNLITWNDSLRFYLVSSPDSCIYTEDANTITLTQEEDSDGTIRYQAQAISATGSDEELDLFGEDGPLETDVPFRHENDSIAAGNVGTDFYDYTLDPLILYTEDRLVSRGMQNADGSYNVTTARDETWGNRSDNDPSDRMRNDIQRKPYVDDLYRADDRWGPKPKYGTDAKYIIDQLVDNSGNPIGFEQNGDLIEASDADDLNPKELMGLNPPDDFPQEVGLDGYWERRAYVQGLRVIVGQRLELGSPFRQGTQEQPLKINFQSSGATTPSGFIADTGAAYSTQGDFTYGWLDSTGTNPEQNDEGRDRNQGSTPQERDTINHMDLGGPHWWQIDLPNDTYELRIVMGDPSNDDSVNDITLEPGTANEVVITDPNAAANNFDVYPDDIALTTLEVTIDDGNLKIRPDAYAKIAYIEFLNYEVPVVAPSLSFDPLAALLPPDPAELPSDQEDSNLRRQQKTLRDNLAAVQATAIYHYNDDNDGDDGGVGDFPMACLATTAHPGTLTTIENSTTFANDAADNLETNFLQGRGTNGWEFNTPGANNSEFENLVDENSDPLRRALTNLAYFSGDPYGAFPPRQDTTDGDDTNDAVPNAGPTVHPYPQLTKWGNFSNLRRTIDLLNDSSASVDYDDLSLADQTTLQTSACMLGMLAYNLKTYQDYDYSANTGDLNTLDGTLASATGNTYEEVVGSLSESDQKLARMIHLKEQIQRDREFGFDESTANVTDFTTLLGITNGDGLNKLLPTGYKYPSLYYLFPIAEHAHDGTLSSGALGAGATEVTQPDTQAYIDDDYIFSADDSGTTLDESGVNWRDDDSDGANDLFFVVVDDSSSNGIEDGTEDSLDAIALTPRDRATEWELPYTETEPTAASGATLTDAAINEITDDTTSVYIPFLDKGMYNGRQLMMARVLNIDLGILRDNFSGGITNDNINDESWLPNSGLVYAFREDALREDGIARPRATDWTSCDTEAELTDPTGDCTMDPNIPRDPPKRDANAVSPKPVDFVADPARRPNGFRLSNGSELGRVGTNRGLSFITDNPAYTLGDFNLHSREEFTESLNRDSWNNFYSRDTLDTGFARGDATNPNNVSFDTWRPTEVLADAITVLSNVYCDGTIEAGIRENNNSNVSGCSGSTESFHNTNIDGTNNNAWILEDGSTAPSGTNNPSPVPIYVDRNGDLFFGNSGTPTRYTGYQGTTNGRPLNNVGNSGETTINLVFISGLSPTRVNETYGGLHNFPRFNENWNTNLNISGSIIQLNFSSYDSANLDQQNTFAPTDNPNGGAGFPFYSPPNRRWGYDPALQYNPPGPVVERLLSQSGLRTEIYQEVEADDRYIQELCRAVNDLNNTTSDICP